MSRPDIDVYMSAMALLVSSRATCSRRAVGCVLTNSHNHVLATGYNGVPKNFPHCNADLCPGMNSASGSSLDGCMATHAEQNALLQCRDTQSIFTAYVTASPCITCTKLLLNTSCHRIVFMEEYPHSKARELWTSVGRAWIQCDRAQVKVVEELFQMLSDRSDSALIKSR